MTVDLGGEGGGSWQRVSCHTKFAIPPSSSILPSSFPSFSPSIPLLPPSSTWCFLQAGVDVPSVTVEYRNLRVDTEALVGAASVATVASVPLGIIKRLLCLHRGRESRPLRILNDLQGKLVPGRLTLLLGPPSCGKSSFMRALTSRLIPAQGKVSGDIRYNGYKLDEFNVLRSSAYVDQIDNHNPNLTVRETLDFAHACQVGLHGASFNLPAELAAHHIASRQSQPAAIGNIGYSNGNNGNGNNGQNGDSTYSGGTGVNPGNDNANGNGHNHPGSSSNACRLKALRHTHNGPSLLEQAVRVCVCVCVCWWPCWGSYMR
ncbi:hypothetical protein Vafri_16118 [Volvox africanus]|nr:hypothetical protein Vafri_16118 [Volvox africanus]